MQDRKDQPKSGKLKDMIMYVDEFGNFSETPLEPEDPEGKKSNQQNSNKSQ